MGVPWQLLAALADAEGNGTAADEQFTGPFRIATEGVTAEQAGSLPESADIIARTLRAALADREIAVSADMLTMSAIQPTSGGFDTAGTRSAATDPAAARGDGGRRRADRPAGGIPTVPSSS